MPSVPPSHVNVHNTSSTSLKVTWVPVPQEYVHGVLLGYTVVYRVSDSDRSKLHYVSTSNTSIELTRLNKFTVYSVRVMAFTVIGQGNASDWLLVSTDEDGEQTKVMKRNKVFTWVHEGVNIFFSF